MWSGENPLRFHLTADRRLHHLLVRLFEAMKTETDNLALSELIKERGQHLKFGTRGIGLDVCPCCFVCGGKERSEGSNHYLNNIAAFMASKADGEKAVEWFSGRARLDFRESEPDWIQIKVGACDAHMDNLKALAKATGRYGVIREKDIEDALRLSESTPPDLPR